MIFITGDIHGNLTRVKHFVDSYNTTTNDILIILGDVGFNYWLDGRDTTLKEMAKELPITFFCIRGNHEERPETAITDTYALHTQEFCGDSVLVENNFPNIKYAMDGHIYNFNGAKCLVMGGAYSVDKDYRIMRNWKWFEDEQLSENELRNIYNNIKGQSFDYVLTHTCPFNTQPTHLFLDSIDQDSVDKTMEHWFQDIADSINFKYWYFGHYHGNWQNDRYIMLYTDFLQLGDELYEN